jgi:hypothetical protein
VPNTITPQELENLNLPDLGRHLSLKRAGWIQPTSAGNSCEVVIREITTCVLYCEIVDGHAMKFGTAGSLEIRQNSFNRRTINNILAFQDGRYRGTNRKITDPSTYDKYKRLAPEAIRSGKKIEIYCPLASSRSHGSPMSLQSATHSDLNWRRPTAIRTCTICGRLKDTS